MRTFGERTAEDGAKAGAKGASRRKLGRSAPVWLAGMAMAACSCDATLAEGGGVQTAQASATVQAAKPAEQPADRTLLLEVYINGNATGKIAEFTLHNRMLFSRRSELNELGFRLPGALKSRLTNTSQGNELVALFSIGSLAWRLDEAAQALYITISEARRVPTSLQVEPQTPPDGDVRGEGAVGATINYDVAATFTGGRRNLNGVLDSRAFSPAGVLSSGLLGYINNSIGGGPPTTALARLDTTYTFGDVRNLRRYSVGDFITTGLSWTRPVRQEGAQIRSDFTLRPDLITFPLPTVTGSVAVPSAVTVLADGNLVLARQIEAGPFEIPQLPVASGAGTISLTLTNALGQQVRISQPFYASAALLRPGLQAFSAQAGLVRLNFGVQSDRYGKLAGAATYRRGVNYRLTLEGAAEGTSGVGMAGGGGLLQLKSFGVLNAAVAASGGSGQSGFELNAGAQHLGRAFSFGASSIFSSGGFADVAAKNGDPVPRRQMSANLSVSTKRLGSVGVFYAGLDRASAVNVVDLTATPAQRSRVLTASYTFSVRHVSFFVNGFNDFAASNGPGIQAGVTIPLGVQQSAQIATGTDGTAQLQIQKSATKIGDVGYQAYVSTGAGTHEFGQAQYKSRWGLVTGGIDSNGGSTAMRLEGQGSISTMDRAIYLANTIYDSFAIVDTGAALHIHVLQENREVGTTGSSGRLLVPDLRSYDLNRLAIVPTDVGLDTTIQESRREVRPPDRSGVIVRFKVRISHAALLLLVDESGDVVAVGSTAQLVGTDQLVPVGYEGQAYVEDLKPRNKVEVTRRDGHRCVAEFSYKPRPGEIPALGPLRCTAVTPEARP